MSTGKKKNALAKLTRPRLHHAVARERLFKFLDDARTQRPTLCVVGPPGAGKTTLVASWLDARRMGGVWYQIDSGDADLATFFYYLREAADAYKRKGQAVLPLLTPEYLQDIERFSRRFLRDFFARLPAGSALVLDNYQEVPGDQPLHRLISQAVDEVPAGVMLIVISRQDPPSCYARLIANDNVAFVHWDALKLTVDEARMLVGARVAIAENEVRRLHAHSEGWAAGLVLLAERTKAGASAFELTSPDVMKNVFDYFADELFENSSPVVQGMLIRLSFLPSMGASASISLTGCSDAVVLLEDYYRRRLFTDRRGSTEGSYQFHALFRAFLQHKARALLSAGGFRQVALDAARLIEHQGDRDAAFALYMEGGHADDAARLALRDAGELIAQGRWRTVVNFITALPVSILNGDAGLLYWLGTALTPVEPKRARAFLEASYALAMQEGERTFALLAVAGIIQTYMLEYRQFLPLDPWIDRLRQYVRGGAPFDNPDVELRVRSALLAALSFRQPGDPLLEECAERVLVLLEESTDATLRTLSAAYLVYCARTGPVQIAFRAQPLLQELVRQPDLSALTVGWCWWAIAYSHLVAGNHDACRRAVTEADRIGREESLATVARFAAAIGAHVEMDAGNVAEAQRWADRLDAESIPGLAYDRALCNTIHAFLAVMKDDIARARVLAEEAVGLFDVVGVHQLRCLTRAQVAWPLMMQGEHDEAESAGQEALALALAARAEWVELEVRAVLAACALAREDWHSLDARLRAAFVLLKKTRYTPTLNKFRGWTARLCDAALARGIETSNVRDLIRRLSLKAPSGRNALWPWKIRIHTLGRFAMEVDDEPLTFSRKTPRKVITLLKALVAFGEQQVPMDRLLDVLWPDEEGDRANDACWLTLNRLRKLLGAADAVQLTGGRISLNAEMVWTDAACFAQASNDDTAQPVDVEAVLAIYRGHFLDADPDTPWAAPHRERLRARFVRLAARHGSGLEAASQHEKAIALYLLGIERDSVAGPLYEGLVRCYLALGRTAEAQKARSQLARMQALALSPD